MSSIDPRAPLAAAPGASTPPLASAAPSDWAQRWSHLVAPGATVLDVACGSGRHMKWFSQRGHPVVGVDLSAQAVSASAPYGQALMADIENGPWPFMEQGRHRPFGAVVVTNYLWRPRFDDLLQSLAPDGVLIYETFATGNEALGKPSRPDFLLQPGELLQRCAGLHVVAYENGYLDNPARYVQRIAAVRPSIDASLHPIRWPLKG